MSTIPSPTEQALQALIPAALGEEFLARLIACAEETDTALSEEEIRTETQLRSLEPRAIPSLLQTKLGEAIADTPFAVDEKIVLFHKSSTRRLSETSKKSRNNIIRFNIAAAAAVALLGSFAAVMLPQNKTDQSGADNSVSIERFVPIAPSNSNVAPASYNRTLVGTRDEGVIWQNKTQPYRVLSHTYRDRIITENRNGEVIEKEQPHVEYSLIPEKVD